MTKTFLNYLTMIRHFMVFSAVLVLSVVLDRAVYAAEDSLLEFLRVSTEETQQSSYIGTMVYKHFGRMDGQEDWHTEFTIFQLSPTVVRLEFHRPKPIEGNVLIRTNAGVWVTPEEGEKLEKVKDEFKRFPWYRLLEPDDRAFFQPWLDLSDDGLLIKNYNLSKVSSKKIGGREAFGIDILPKNKKRPSLHLVMDTQTKIQLNCLVKDYHNKPIESFLFTSFDLKKELSMDLFDVEGLHQIKSFKDESQRESYQVRQLEFCPLELTCMPKGFELLSKDIWKQRRGFVYRTVLTDGFARISLFQRSLSEKEKEELKKEKSNSSKDHIVNRIVRPRDVTFSMDTHGIRLFAVGDLKPHEMIDILVKMKPCDP